jgi:hypothetical protein
VISFLYRYIFAAQAHAASGELTPEATIRRALHVDSDASSLTFHPMVTVSGSQLTFMHDIVGPTPAAPCCALARAASYGASNGASNGASAALRDTAAPERLQRLSEATAELPEHLLLALALVSANGGQAWCPTAGLFLARYAYGKPFYAAQPAYAGMLTATALLVATKLIEGNLCSIRGFVPACAEIMYRVGDFDLDSLDPVGHLLAAESEFLNTIAFSISAPRHTVAWYAQEIETRKQAFGRMGGSLHNASLRRAIARSLP